MKFETIRAFQEALKDNPAAEEIIRNTPEPRTEEERIRVYAKIAAELGYDLTEQDLSEYVEKWRQRQQERTQDAIDRIQELPPEELGEAAGGGDHANCMGTYIDKENCWYFDGCDNVYQKYKGYHCHLFNACQNHPSCGEKERRQCIERYYG